MTEVHKGIVLRASSEYKSAATILDEQYGKIEGLDFNQKRTNRLFHGALITYATKKSRSKYIMSDIHIIGMPDYWVREHFLFFHHVLELADYFLPWEQQATALFQLVHVLYSDPEAVGTKRAQKVFLYHFFKRLGMYPEDGLVPFDKERIETWLRACIDEHPQAASLQTMSFLKTMELHEEPI